MIAICVWPKHVAVATCMIKAMYTVYNPISFLDTSFTVTPPLIIRDAWYSVQPADS